MSKLGRLVRRIRSGAPVIVVSGLPRSGTSMTMKMLEAGGLQPVTDQVRSADEDNPRGYFEDERVKDLAQMEDRSWLRAARGKVIKVISSLLQHLPEDNYYKVIFMRRNLREVLASQAKMLDRRGEAAQTSDDELIQLFESHLGKVEFQLRFRPWFDVLYVDHRSVLQDPAGAARRINDFLGGRLDERRMAEAVDPNLYRNRAEDLEAAKRSGS
ncbi:MAG TPA: sulfotransferase domain-containing protein [Thermoanaerobaculales bacterium]|nr:sulfotransferase domain-containing protein [Thermoanaerobaculales bacterium]HPA82010.1 sulfotransferase domain-containing protein [Thermoanaerobaculales bacterium]HQN96506.1 sulfotransferase domain-containing protein [Thermoanaerobaculales bacterium]HQP42900.1 sulfotransferase domain-containing protein [Thermoanaerobaculales bacterium]